MKLQSGLTKFGADAQLWNGKSGSVLSHFRHVHVNDSSSLFGQFCSGLDYVGEVRQHNVLYFCKKIQTQHTDDMIPGCESSTSRSWTQLLALAEPRSALLPGHTGLQQTFPGRSSAPCRRNPPWSSSPAPTTALAANTVNRSGLINLKSNIQLFTLKY